METKPVTLQMGQRVNSHFDFSPTLFLSYRSEIQSSHNLTMVAERYPAYGYVKGWIRVEDER